MGISSKFLRVSFLSMSIASGTGTALAEQAQWESYIDISALEGDTRADVSMALDWLEKYYGSFHEILWDLRDRQQSGTLDKITITHDWHTYYDRHSATVALDYNPDKSADLLLQPPFYLGVDSKFYLFSLIETLVHELQHGAQENGSSAQSFIDADEAVRRAIAPKLEALKRYLVGKGITDANANGTYDANFDREQCEVSDYLFGYDRNALTKESCDKTILQDPEYIHLHDEWFRARLAIEHSAYAEEDDAMDMTNALSGLLGKAARGHYHDTNLFHYYMKENLPYADEIYTDPPDVIRQSPQGILTAPEVFEAYPLITGDPNDIMVNVQDMQCDWTNKWNGDTKNISVQGWIRVNDFKLDYFKSRDFDSLTQADREAYDAALRKLIAKENEARPEICPTP